MNRITSLPALNVIAYVVTLIINFLSQSASTLGVSLFASTVAELGESRAIFFLPAGYVFSIWGVIYLGLGAYVIYQSRPAQRNNPIIDRIGYWFILSSIGNSLWLILFLNDQTGLSTLAMLLLLVSLLAIYLRLGIGRTPVSALERWVVHIPFSIYLGWITVATVANIAAALYVEGNVTAFAGISADVWTVVMMAVAAVLSVVMLFTRGDIAYALVPVWALVGILARPFNTATYAPVSALNAGLVDTAALIAAVVIVVAIVARVIMSQRGAGPLARAA